jgi:hypothetical protein
VVLCFFFNWSTTEEAAGGWKDTSLRHDWPLRESQISLFKSLYVLLTVSRMSASLIISGLYTLSLNLHDELFESRVCLPFPCICFSQRAQQRDRSIKDTQAKCVAWLEKLNMSRVWWFSSVIPALRKLRQEGHEFKVSLCYRVKWRLTWAIVQVTDSKNKFEKEPQNGQL